MNKEYRSATLTNDGESRRIEGVCTVFNSWSEDLGFREIIHEGAVTEETIKSSDIIMCFEHDPEKMLARSKYGEGTLEMNVQPDGVHIAFDAPNTQLGDEMLYHLRAGNLTSMSFAFTMSNEDGAQKWYKNEDGVLCREIFKIDRLWDSSIVINPAYEATSVYARSVEDAKAEGEKALAKQAEEERERVKQNMFCELNKKLKNTLNYV